MTLDPTRPGLSIGIAGAGVMGRGIAQVAAAGGCAVRLVDIAPGAAAKARDFVAAMLNRAADKGRMNGRAAAAAIARLEIADGVEGLAGCAAIFEAVGEDLGVKRRLFTDLEAHVDPDALLVTNTSSLTVTEIAADMARPERAAACHFFNPVPLMELAEVAGGDRTAAAVTKTVCSLARRFGRWPLVVSDVAGFVVNRVGRAYVLEAAKMAEDGIASPAAVDRIMREEAGFRMGPFELMDLTGLDVTYPASLRIYEGSGGDPRFRPPQWLRRRFEDGLFGRKTGRGFYVYENGEAIAAEAGPNETEADPGTVAEPILATIVNLGCLVAGEGRVAAADIDRAVIKGLGYPQGPLAWGDSIGPERVVETLDRLKRSSGDERYEAVSWLRRRAGAGHSLLAPEP